MTSSPSTVNSRAPDPSAAAIHSADRPSAFVVVSTMDRLSGDHAAVSPVNGSSRMIRGLEPSALATVTLSISSMTLL